MKEPIFDSKKKTIENLAPAIPSENNQQSAVQKQPEESVVNIVPQQEQVIVNKNNIPHEPISSDIGNLIVQKLPIVNNVQSQVNNVDANAANQLQLEPKALVKEEDIHEDKEPEKKKVESKDFVDKNVAQEILKKLEEHQENERKLLKEQKEILEELKQHREKDKEIQTKNQENELNAPAPLPKKVVTGEQKKNLPIDRKADVEKIVRQEINQARQADNKIIDADEENKIIAVEVDPKGILEKTKISSESPVESKLKPKSEVVVKKEEVIKEKERGENL